ncbi:MAG: D-alanyl-D-alanine carboxypeptidase family protein [Armatimonadota bacterium]
MRSAQVLALCAVALTCGPPQAQAVDDPPVEAQSVVLMDAADGTVLYERAARVSRYPASLTKILTAILVIEEGELDEIVTVGKRPAAVGESSISLADGEQIPLEHLLQAILIKSANDAASAAGEHLAGSVDAFVDVMNRRARELGATGTHFTNPHGLHDPDHYTTAYDLAVLTRHAMGLERFRELVATTRATIPWPGHKWDRVLINRNELLGKYPGVNGVKTGYTRAAGRCIVLSAKQGHLSIIGVLLKTEHLWRDARAFLDWALARFERVRLVRAGGTAAYVSVANGRHAQVRAVAAEDIWATVPREEVGRARLEFTRPTLAAPVAKGQPAGSVEVRLADGRTLSTGLVAAREVRLTVWAWTLRHWSLAALSLVILFLALWLPWYASRKRWPRQAVGRGGSVRRS